MAIKLKSKRVSISTFLTRKQLAQALSGYLRHSGNPSGAIKLLTQAVSIAEERLISFAEIVQCLRTVAEGRLEANSALSDIEQALNNGAYVCVENTFNRQHLVWLPSTDTLSMSQEDFNTLLPRIGKDLIYSDLPEPCLHKNGQVFN